MHPPRRRSLRPASHVATVATTAGILAAFSGACTGAGTEDSDNAGGTGGDRVDADRMAEVAEDSSATADEIVDAGRPVDAATGPGRTHLITYTVDPPTSEGRSASAWRLYDHRGRDLATGLSEVTLEGAATPFVRAVADGYLLIGPAGRATFHITATGTIRQVRDATSRPPAAGDLAPIYGSARLYRPEDRIMFTPTPAAGDWQGWTVTDDGSLVRQLGYADGEIQFQRSAGGSKWEPIAGHKTTPRTYIPSLTLTAVGDHVVTALTTEGSDLEHATLDGLLVRRTDAPSDAAWKFLPTDVPGDADSGRDRWWEPAVRTLDDTTVALVPTGESAANGTFLVDLTTSTWTRLPAPGTEGGWEYEFEDGRIYAIHPERSHTRVSTDLGATWTRLPH